MVNTLIIIRGPLGIGKTTISKIFAERIGAKVVSIDKLLEDAKLDRVDPKSGCIPVANFLAVEEDVLEDIRKFLERQSVIVDGNFYYKEQIDFFAKNLKHEKMFVVTLKAKVETCINRNRKRGGILKDKDVQEVYALVRQFDSSFVVDVEGKTREQIVEQIQKGMKG
jgi:shikimate kinase